MAVRILLSYHIRVLRGVEFLPNLEQAPELLHGYFVLEVALNFGRYAHAAWLGVV